MQVKVVDRAAQSRAWGYGPGGASPYLRTVEIADTCPACGGPRGTPGWMRQCEDGDWYYVNVWANACGHVDMYGAVIDEAESLQALAS